MGYEVYPSKTAAVDTRDAVMSGQAFVHKGVVRTHQLQNTAIRAYLIVNEQLRLALKRLAKILVKLRKPGWVRIVPVEISEIQPLPDEVLGEGAGTRVRHHPSHLAIEDARLTQDTTLGQVQ